MLRTIRGRWLAILAVPIAALSMGGGCPQGGGTGNGGNDLTVDVTIQPASAGTVDQSADGNEVTLTATAASGFVFDHWSGTGFTDSTANPITVDASAFGALTANFTEEQPPPSPADRDNDEVADAQDQCLNTPEGEPVDANGCSASQLDSDNDGVSDALDECPDTPARTNVDATGCSVSEPPPPRPVCGNGTVEAGEECDDGNTTDGDLCSSTCQTEPGGPKCGDGHVDSGEECDNGTANSDTAVDACRTDCHNHRCGDHVKDTGEQCDDGNKISGDGCSATCQTEGGGPPPPTALCGNNVVESGEQCDDGNNAAGDGCSPTCKREECGNHTVDPGEQCDDGNIVSGDGCSATCQAEGTGPRCGDNHIDPPGETCDDGNHADGDGCSSTCQTESICGNGTTEPGEQCDDGNTVPGDGCDAFCRREALCGNNIIEFGETCDDGNTVPGDGCDATCQREANVVPNDACENATQISDGSQNFSTTLATTDGSPDPACNFFSNNQVNNDIWYCYTATCTGSAVVSLCGSSYDTKLAVYNGCGCPAASPLACNDDGCGSGVERVESRVTVSVTSGQKYMVRVGGYIGARGDGKLTIRCGVDTCAGATNDCFAANASSNPGCSDPTCCQKTCALDTFCCDVAWDDFCAGEARGACTGNFPACSATSGSCGAADGTPGCDNATCCNKVCGADPYCCLTDWDQNCVDEAQSCFLSCDSRAGDCLTAHATPGCNQVSCCEKICAAAVNPDPFCCDTEWDADCAAKANSLCR